VYFEYGTRELEYLKKKDRRLAALIEKKGMIYREIISDPFTALVSSIVSQQISNKAAETVWTKLIRLAQQITPQHIAALDNQAIQQCGMTMRKAEYIKGIAEAALNGEVDFRALRTMSDEEIIKQLSALKGVGVWTVEMLLIFSLNRLDVISYKDLAICRGIMKLYGLSSLSKEEFDKYRERYSPYASVASLYLWELASD